MLARQLTTSAKLLKRAAPSTLPARLAAVPSSPPPEVFSSEEVSDRKSRFVGHAANVKTLEEVRGFVEEVLADKRNKRATHPAMLAWRLKDDSGKSLLTMSRLGLTVGLDVLGEQSLQRRDLCRTGGDPVLVRVS